MCFSNLPVEFDENGDPYLADDAEDVDHVDCGCEEATVDLSTDPERAYEAIVDSLPEDAREHVERESPRPNRPSAESD